MKTKQISGTIAADAEVKAILASLDGNMTRNARVVAKGFAKDKKLNDFLSAQFDKGLSFFTDSKRRAKIFDSVADYGVTSLKEKQAAILKLLGSDVDQEVERKRIELTKGLTLTSEQKEALVANLTAYGKFLKNTMMVGILDTATFLGVVEDVEAPEPALTIAGKTALTEVQA